MDFHSLNLDDKSSYERALSQSPLYQDYLGSELNFANLFVWRRYDAIECVTLAEGTVVSRGVHSGVPFYFPPIAASEDAFVAALARLEKDAADANVPFLVRGLTARLVDVVRRSGRHYRIDAERNLFEYLFDAAALRTLAGNKYHAKRNFLNRFLKNGDYLFRPYADADQAAVEEMLQRWERRKLQAFEHDAILEVLDRRDDLGCFADLLFVGDRLAAFSIGTFQGSAGLTLFEKADTGYAGVYAAINYLFANAHYGNVRVINRQEDLGIPELRKSKMSYAPIGFVEKYSLVRDHLAIAEIAQLRSLYAEAFPDSQGYIDYFFRNKYRSDNVVFHKEDGRIVSALHFIRKQLMVRGQEFPVPFVAAAATRTSERQKGLMTAVVRQALAELYNRKTALCALSPFRESFYAPFGFTTVCRVKTVQIAAAPGDGRTTRIATEDDLPALDALYRARTGDYDVFVERKLDAWSDFFAEVAADGGHIVMILENGEPTAYFSRFGDVVEELCLPAEKDVASYSALDGLTVDLEGDGGDDARVMIRIVDVVRFLSTFPYDPDAECARRLRIVDPFFPQNNLSIEWIVAHGVARIREIEDADETMSIAELTTWIFQSGKPPFGCANALVFDRY